MTLWRAARDNDVTQGTCFAAARSAAEAYLDNGDFGGPVLYRCQTPANGRVLTIEGGSIRDGISALTEAGVDGDLIERRLLAASTLAQLVDGTRVLEALADLGYDWVVYEDDYPEDCTTWRVVSRDAMWAATDGMVEVEVD